jgi:hypothetical protein
MELHYKNGRLERTLIGINTLACAVVTGTFVWLFGFDKPLLPSRILFTIQIVASRRLV